MDSLELKLNKLEQKNQSPHTAASMAFAKDCDSLTSPDGHTGKIVSIFADQLGVALSDLLGAMNDSVRVLNGKGFDLRTNDERLTCESERNHPANQKPSGVFLYTGAWSWVEAAVKNKALVPLGWIGRVVDIRAHQNDVVMCVYYNAEDHTNMALQAAKRGEIVTCEEHCKGAQAEMQSATDCRDTEQHEFRRAMENLYAKPSLNGRPREKPPQTDDEPMRAFRNIHKKITTALQVTKFLIADICEKHCREAKIIIQYAIEYRKEYLDKFSRPDSKQ